MIVRILSLSAALLVVNGILLLPGWIAPGPSRGLWIALEAGFVVGSALLLPPGRATRIGAAALAGASIAIGLLGIADAAARLILARPLNLYVDVRLGRAIVSLLYGNAGLLLGTLVSLLAVAAIAAAGWGLTRLLASMEQAWDPSDTGRRAEIATGTTLVATCLLLSVGIGSGSDAREPITRVGTPAVALVSDQASRLAVMMSERDNFAAAVAEAPVGYGDVPGLLRGLGGRDVVLAFIESYGISALDDPRYGDVILPRLAELGERVERAGLHMASGTLVAPTQGGESWFSHGSLLSGLWLANQVRYDLMIADDRETLVDDFEHAGYRTVAVMPAITYAWPEGEALGYDTIYARNQIPYAGPPLNWVTMPDQFVWHFVQREIIEGAGESPVFAEIGLISSHAPWTPVLEVLDDWEEIGDGAVFEQWRGAGEAPEVLWLDTDRVREHYARSVDYALDAMTGFTERYVDEDILLIAMGDHQPAPLVTGEAASWQVPVHVVSGDRALLEPFLEWGFDEGPFPSREHPDRGMDYFRDWFVHAYSSNPVPAEDVPAGTHE